MTDDRKRESTIDQKYYFDESNQILGKSGHVLPPVENATRKEMASIQLKGISRET
jgi:hypothetical protein